MAEKQETMETPNEQAWMDGMNARYPELNGDREALFAQSKKGYDEQHEELKGARDYISKSQAEAAELNGILESNEDLNKMFIEIFQRGKDGHPQLALRHMKPILRKYINGEITDEEYLREEEEAKLAAAEKDKKLAMQQAAFEAECKERGWDPEETITRMQSILDGEDVKNEEDARRQVKEMFKMLDFDEAVNAAEVRGRNAKIKEEHREPSGDGNRNGGSPSSGAEGNPNTVSAHADAAYKRRKMFE